MCRIIETLHIKHNDRKATLNDSRKSIRLDELRNLFTVFDFHIIFMHSYLKFLSVSVDQIDLNSLRLRARNLISQQQTYTSPSSVSSLSTYASQQTVSSLYTPSTQSSIQSLDTWIDIYITQLDTQVCLS